MAQITSTVLRIRKLSSLNRDIWMDLRWTLNAFIRQAYPKHIVLQTMFKALAKPIYLATSQVNKVSKNTLTHAFTYFPNITDPQIKVWRKSISQVNPDMNLLLTYKCCNNLGNFLSNTKPQKPSDVDAMNTAGVVYGVTCNECTDQQKFHYIGETSRPLKLRLNSHYYDKTNQSSISEHLQNSKHKKESLQFKILKSETDAAARKVWESIFIKKFKPNWNKDGGAQFYLK